MSAIHDAVANNDVARVKSLINASSLIIEEIADYTQQRPIHIAAKKGHVAVLDQLLKAGADINAKSMLGTPLHYASSLGIPQIVEFLIQNGADVNAEDHDGNTPLRLAKKNRHHIVVKLLEDHNAIDSKKGTCLGMMLFVRTFASPRTFVLVW